MTSTTSRCVRSDHVALPATLHATLHHRHVHWWLIIRLVTLLCASRQVWEYNDQYRRWQVVIVLEGHSAPIHDVAWAPNLGRSYHLIASASKGSLVLVSVQCGEIRIVDAS